MLARTRLWILLLWAPVLLLGEPKGPLGESKTAERTNVLFQVSTLDALTQGIYQGALTFRELKQHGDFGVGTFDSLDGEMIALNGRFYQMRSDGTVSRVEGGATTPFAAVTTFHTDLRVTVKQPTSLAELTALVDRLLPSKNLFYAIQVHGRYAAITTRSVPKQYPPFPPLGNVVAQQSLFPLHDIDGTLVGFRSPAFVKGINQVGYHFHFISEDEQAGGHVLSLEITDAIVEIGILRQYPTFLPDLQPFLDVTLPLP